MARLTKTLSSGLAIAVLFSGAAAFAQTTGGVRGRVSDASNGRGIDGVVVVARGPALQGEQIAMTEANGSFTISFLPPGEYTLRFEGEGFRVEQMRHVQVQLGHVTPVAIDLVPLAVEAEAITVTATAPTVDRGSTEIGTNINREFIRNTPSARRYTEVLRETPGSSSDAYGTTVFGSTSVENTYVIEGLNTTDTGFGRAAADMNVDFFEEIEVKTGGYMPEFGRSTGGIFNLVLRNGGNDFHGDVFVNAAPGFLRARETPIYRIGEAIGRQDDRTLDLDVGADIGGPIIRDRLWFFAGFNPQFTFTDVSRIYQTRVDRAGDGLDADGNPDPDEPIGQPDGSPDLDRFGNPVLEEVGREHLDRKRTSMMLAGKLTLALDQNNRLSLAYFGNPATRSGVLRAIDDDRFSNGIQGSEDYYAGERSFGSHNVMLTYNANLFDRHLEVEAFAGRHAQHDVNARASDVPGFESAFPRPLDDFEQERCPERDDTPFIDCEVSSYRGGGQGGFYDESLTRTVAGFRLTNLFARHRLRYGFDTELKTYNSTRGYAGGYFGVDYDGVADLNGDGVVDGADLDGDGYPDDNAFAHERDFYARANPDAPWDPYLFSYQGNDDFSADVSNTTLSAFLQDSWELDRYFTLNGGVRWDFEQLGGAAGDSPITIPDEVVPRLGISFDPTGVGRGRFFASWGWFYESIPMDINQRAFSREGLSIRYVDDAGNLLCFGPDGNPVPGGTPPACTYDPYFTGDYNENGQFDPDEFSIYGGENAAVANDLKGQFHEEFIAGAEYEVVPDWVVGASGVVRRLRRAIEDISPDNGNSFFIANPGVNDCNVPDEYRAALTDVCSDEDGNYDENATVFPEPRRFYMGLVLSLRKRLANHSQLLASYTLSRLEGDYPGLYAPDNDQLDPNLSSQYDILALLPNRYGPLPGDHTHSIKLAGSYELGGLTRSLSGLTIGLAYHGETGSPYSYLGRSTNLYYGRLESFILPRGEAGRTPFTHQFDSFVGYDIPITAGIKLNFNVTVFNMFNFQEAILVDQEYTTDSVNPRQAGTALEDLHPCDTQVDGTCIDDDSRPVSVNPTFGEPRLRQAPLFVRLGARLTF